MNKHIKGQIEQSRHLWEITAVRDLFKITIVVIIGGIAGGILGLLFAIPVAACIKIFIEEVLFPKAASNPD